MSSGVRCVRTNNRTDVIRLNRHSLNTSLPASSSLATFSWYNSHLGSRDPEGILWPGSETWAGEASGRHQIRWWTCEEVVVSVFHSSCAKWSHPDFLPVSRESWHEKESQGIGWHVQQAFTELSQRFTSHDIPASEECLRPLRACRTSSRRDLWKTLLSSSHLGRTCENRCLNVDTFSSFFNFSRLVGLKFWHLWQEN